MPRLTTLFADWAALNGAGPQATATTDADTGASVTRQAADDTAIEGIPPVPPPAISAGVTSPAEASPAGSSLSSADPSQIPAPPSARAASGAAYAEVLLRACAPLSDEVLRALPATPEDAAAELAESPFADRVDGSYLAFEWIESLASELDLPLAELDNGWDISDTEDVFFCPKVMLADNPDHADDMRPFVRVDQVRAWPA